MINKIDLPICVDMEFSLFFGRKKISKKYTLTKKGIVEAISTILEKKENIEKIKIFFKEKTENKFKESF